MSELTALSGLRRERHLRLVQAISEGRWRRRVTLSVDVVSRHCQTPTVRRSSSQVDGGAHDKSEEKPVGMSIKKGEKKTAEMIGQ